MNEITEFVAVGRRKEAAARVRMRPGSGVIKVNKRDYEEYFDRETLLIQINRPFKLTGTAGKYDIIATLDGGGISGQADALKHGISRALLKSDPGLRITLRKAGLLTRDPRAKERKKYGQKGARKKFQFSKR